VVEPLIFFQSVQQVCAAAHAGHTQRLNANGRMVVIRKIVHLLKIVLAGKISFQKCPPALSLKR